MSFTRHNNFEVPDGGVQNWDTSINENFELQEKGQTIKATAGITLAVGKVVHMNVSERLTLAISPSGATTTSQFLGFTTTAINQEVDGYIQTNGNHLWPHWSFTPGPVYLDATTPGEVTQTEPTIANLVGYAIGTNELTIKPWIDPTTTATAHSSLTGLVDPADDHTQYLATDNRRSTSGLTVTGNLQVDGTIVGDFDLPRSYLTGLGTSLDTDTAHDIAIAVGECRDDTDAGNIALSAILTKQIDASWAVGDDAGGLDGTESVGGTPDASTWYYVFAIKRTDTGVVDALFSENATAPTLPTNYDLQRRIGAVLTDGSANIIAFVQEGDEFLWDVPVSDYNANDPGTSAVTRALTVPLGLVVHAKHAFKLQDISPVAFTDAIVTSLDQADTAPSGTLNHIRVYTEGGQGSVDLETKTNTSAQIRTRINASDTDTTIIGTTFGWKDRRGRDD